MSDSNLQQRAGFLPLEVLGLDCSACWIPAATAPPIACTFTLATVNHYTCGHEVALIRAQPAARHLENGLLHIYKCRLTFINIASHL